VKCSKEKLNKIGFVEDSAMHRKLEDIVIAVEGSDDIGNHLLGKRFFFQRILTVIAEEELRLHIPQEN